MRYRLNIVSLYVQIPSIRQNFKNKKDFKDGPHILGVAHIQIIVHTSFVWELFFFNRRFDPEIKNNKKILIFFMIFRKVNFQHGDSTPNIRKTCCQHEFKKYNYEASDKSTIRLQ